MSSELRAAIGQSAYRAVQEYYAQPNDDMQRSEHDLVADAVLAVLEDLPAEVVEETARARWPHLWNGVFEYGLAGLPILTAEQAAESAEKKRAEKLALVRGVLAALAGGESDV